MKNNLIFPVTTKAASCSCRALSVSLHWENCTLIKWVWYIFQLIETSAFLELHVHPTSLNCFPTAFWYTSGKFKFIILYTKEYSAVLIKLHLLFTIFLYFASASMCQSNEIQAIEYSPLTVLSLNWESTVILNSEIKLFSSNMWPVHIDQDGE